MKWCVIGAGGIADRRTIPAIIQDKENELVAVMDRVPETAKAVGEKYGVPYFTDAASESKLELYGTKGYLQARGTLGQEEVGVLTHLYAPQGDYNAAQSRVTYEPKTYTPDGKNLYEYQIRLFRQTVASGTPDYFYAERAVQVQSVVDKIYEQQ